LDSRAVTQTLREIAARNPGRLGFWQEFLGTIDAGNVLEVGVYEGEFAAAMLAGCPSIRSYTMLDPWRHLDNWNKPFNRSDEALNSVMERALDVTAFASDRRHVLRGTTLEVIDEIPDGSLDFAYIDGDHTLRGILIDLIRVFPKLREGGWLAGDDFAANIWGHGPDFEPTLVFPTVVHFAEAMHVPVWAFSGNQFLIHRRADTGFAFHDLAGHYDVLALRKLGAPQAS
jgi:hypothetical protein